MGDDEIIIATETRYGEGPVYVVMRTGGGEGEMLTLSVYQAHELVNRLSWLLENDAAREGKDDVDTRG